MNTDYEHQQRKRVLSIDWAKVHTDGDHGPEVKLPNMPVRRVIGCGVRTARGGFVEERRP